MEGPVFEEQHKFADDALQDENEEKPNSIPVDEDDELPKSYVGEEGDDGFEREDKAQEEEGHNGPEQG